MNWDHVLQLIEGVRSGDVSPGVLCDFLEEHHVALRDAVANLNKLRLETTATQIAFSRREALSIRIDADHDSIRHGDRYSVRCDFVPRAFEYQFYRGDNANVSDFARDIGRQVADKVSKAIKDVISGARQ